jgi:anti-sigma regulatory factor (Ser/Thr protein kinase)
LGLVVSELVTNSVRHSGARRGAPVEVDVRCAQASVRVAVTDPGRGFAGGGHRNAGSEGGWGLVVVAEVADRWWVEPAREGTRVVAEVGRS